MGKEVLYSVHEVAEILEVNPETVRRWIRSGELKSGFYCKKFGHVIDRNVLADFICNDKMYIKYAKYINRMYGGDGLNNE